MSAIVMHESRGRPFAIGLNTKGAKLPRQPQTRGEAVATAKALHAAGYDFDAGLGQINVRNMGWLELTFETLFDPCKNLKAAETVLSDCFTRAGRTRADGQAALRAALSCYNTGNFERGFRNGYVSKVAGQVDRPLPRGHRPEETAPEIVEMPVATGAAEDRTRPDGFEVYRRRLARASEAKAPASQ